jgi:hypothetical protein
MNEPAELFVAAFATTPGAGANSAGRTGSEEETFTGLAGTEESVGKEDTGAAATLLSPDCCDGLPPEGRGQNMTIPSSTAAASSIHFSWGNIA